MSMYRVERRDGLLIVHDPIPLSDMVALMKGEPEGGIVDAALSRRMGAVMVCGTREACDAERERQGIEKEQGA